jgi:hypothetical protein
MEPAADTSDFFVRVILPAMPTESEPDVHRVRDDDPRCTCGLPREECVRQRMRAMWGT